MNERQCFYLFPYHLWHLIPNIIICDSFVVWPCDFGSESQYLSHIVIAALRITRHACVPSSFMETFTLS